MTQFNALEIGATEIWRCPKCGSEIGGYVNWDTICVRDLNGNEKKSGARCMSCLIDLMDQLGVPIMEKVAKQ